MAHRPGRVVQKVVGYAFNGAGCLNSLPSRAVDIKAKGIPCRHKCVDISRGSKV